MIDFSNALPLPFDWFKIKSISFSDYIEFIKPNYLYLKITPSTSLRNHSSDKIISLIASLYKSVFQSVHLINKKLFFECDSKVSYYIYMEKNQVQFYFIVPEKHYTLFKEKLIDTWKNRITITIVPDIPLFNNESTKYFLTYKNEDSLSLACDKRNNVLLNSLLCNLHIMEDGDRIGVFYNFNSINQAEWKAKYNNTIERLKNDISVRREKYDLLWIGSYIMHLAFNFFDILKDCISLGSPKNLNTTKSLYLTDETKKKKNSLVINTQILCMSESSDKLRQKNNAINLCESFKCLDGDNKLIYHKCRKNSANNLLSTQLQGVENITIQPWEGQNFISLPGKEILEEHKVIEHTKVLETQVPKLLQNGYISLGVNTYKGTNTEAFLRDEYYIGNFPLVLTGEQNSGKTTYMANYVRYCLSRNEGCIVIDFIKNCELSETIKTVVPSDKLIELDMSDIDNVQGIGYNELKPKTNKPIDLLDVANRKALYIQMLIDALNTNGEDLTTSMDRYLNAASNIVFLKDDSSLKDVVMCLNDFKIRHNFISIVPECLKDMLAEEIQALTELDEYNKSGEISGTKSSKSLDGINHRINLLRKDLRLKMMFNKRCTDNIDLVKAMDEGKVILIKMPQEYFATPYSKNVITTYWMTKLWNSTIVRGGKETKPKRFHVVIDEIFQTKTAMKLLQEQEILPQTRKFGLKMVLSCQRLEQIKIIDQTLRSAGASYMLLKGSGKINFNEFKDELYPYTLEDMESLPQYHSLNLINYEEGRAKFITKLPKPY